MKEAQQKLNGMLTCDECNGMLIPDHLTEDFVMCKCKCTENLLGCYSLVHISDLNYEMLLWLIKDQLGEEYLKLFIEKIKEGK